MNDAAPVHGKRCSGDSNRTTRDETIDRRQLPVRSTRHGADGPRPESPGHRSGEGPAVTGSDRQSAIMRCFGPSAYCRLYARECVGCYSHMIGHGEAGDPVVVGRVPCERSWVAVTRWRTGARGRSAPPVRPCQPWGSKHIGQWILKRDRIPARRPLLGPARSRRTLSLVGVATAQARYDDSSTAWPTCAPSR